MSHRLAVFVVDSDKRPVAGTEVMIDIQGVFSGGRLTQQTNRDGHAEFETSGDYPSYRKLTIHVRDQRFGPYGISGGSYTIQLE